MENLPYDFDWDSFRNEWDLRLNNDVPMVLSVDLGAGEGDLELGCLSLTKLDIQMGTGDVIVDLTGSPSLTNLDMEMGVGDATVDLTGDWKRDLDASIEVGVGNLTLQLPSDVGVCVDVEGDVGKISANNMRREGNIYVNDGYDKSEVTLHINIEVSVGEINLELWGTNKTKRMEKRKE